MERLHFNLFHFKVEKIEVAVGVNTTLALTQAQAQAQARWVYFPNELNRN